MKPILIDQEVGDMLTKNLTVTPLALKKQLHLLVLISIALDTDISRKNHPRSNGNIPLESYGMS